jgi:hypothetical protein
MKNINQKNNEIEYIPYNYNKENKHTIIKIIWLYIKNIIKK